MTIIYFVRHAEPVHTHTDDATRPLSAQGKIDAGEITKFFVRVETDAFVSSPYRRSIDTVAGAAAKRGLEIITDDRLRERRAGPGGNTHDMFYKRWADFAFAEDGGECLESVQARNLEALNALLITYEGRCVVAGTHGTALATILNYFDPAFGADDFLKIIDLMPYVVRMSFAGGALVGKEVLLKIRRPF